jgi:DNA transformation protein
MKPGLGPASRAMLASVGVHNAVPLAREDVFDRYARIKQQHAKASLNLLCELIRVVDGRDRRTVARENRTSVLMRMDDMRLSGGADPRRP